MRESVRGCWWLLEVFFFYFSKLLFQICSPWGERTKCQLHSRIRGLCDTFWGGSANPDPWKPYLNWSWRFFQSRRRLSGSGTITFFLFVFLLLFLLTFYLFLFFFLLKSQEGFFFSPECPFFNKWNIKRCVPVWNLCLISRFHWRLGILRFPWFQRL